MTATPLAGIRVLEFTHTVMGPTAGLIMAELGADVIKIEPKSGDDMRYSQLSPEWAAKGLGPLLRMRSWMIFSSGVTRAS